MPINNFLSICEFVKIRGNTLKFQELFRMTKQKYAVKTEGNEENEINESTIMEKSDSDKKLTKEEVQIEEKKEEKKEVQTEDVPAPKEVQVEDVPPPKEEFNGIIEMKDEEITNVEDSKEDED
jgi:hypothetical protein